MKNPKNAEVDRKIKIARDLAVASISPSLIPLIFRDLDPRGEPVERLFRAPYLPTTASAISKFSGLLIQAYWYLLRITTGRQDEIPTQLNNILLQVWAGNQSYGQGLAISVLYEASLARGSSGFTRLVRNPAMFLRWKNLLLQREQRYKGLLHQFTIGDWYENFSQLMESLPILREVEFHNDQFIFSEGESGEKLSVPSSFFIHRSSHTVNPLYLYTFENVDSRPEVTFEDPYSNLTEEFLIEESISAELYHVMRQLLGFKDVRPGILHLFGNSYTHINQLALAIANTKGEPLDELIKSFEKKEEYKDVALNGGKEDLITLLIAGEGPTKVLKMLFRRNRGLLDSYLSYFENERSLGKASYWKDEFLRQIEARKKPVESFLALDPTMKDDVLDDFDLDARCWCVIKASGLNIDAPSDYVESIGVRLRMLENIAIEYRNNEIDILTVGVNLAKLVERTMRFLFGFYSGLRGYFKASENYENDYYRCEEAMVLEAGRALKKLGKVSPGILIGNFKHLCNNSDIKNVVDKLLGRTYVCDLAKFNTLMNVVGNEDEWTEKLNRLKHDVGPEVSRPEVSKAEIIDFVDQTRNLFRFLRDGKELSRTQALFGGEPIYPSVISFREQHRKRDGLIIYNYTVRALEGNDVGGNIKILTPHEYAPNENYYCIPFSKKATNEWLLDPFLIRCSKIDAVFRENI